VAEAPVDGWVLHPRDWARLQKVKTEEGGAGKGSYVFGNPSASPFAVASLWGRPGVITTAITAGYFLVGAFRMFATIYDRQEATVDLSTEHSDFFTKNKVAIRAEERIALVVTRPEAFIYGAL
jgi:HK97 family phage major capsid protein